MATESDLVRRANAIPRDQRARHLSETKETVLHRHLVSLFTRAEEKTRAEITHGPSELGRDIVLCREDPFGKRYVGIVVKRNPYDNVSLSGKTAGPIDQIISQARQAIAHPCLLKEITTETVTISEVWIAFFGRMSKTAMERLSRETADISGRRILTLETLVDLFTTHYPEVFFDGEVSEYLTKKIIDLESLEGIAKSPNKLSDRFISPRVMMADARIDLSEEGLSYVFGNENIPFGRLEEYMRPRAKLVLTGDPGSGKSTALRKIALDMLKNAQQTTLVAPSNTKTKKTGAVPIPILITAVDTKDGKTIEQLIEAELPPDDVRIRFSIGIILLDGLDEVPSHCRDQIVKDIFNQADENSCCLIISTRKVPSLQLDIVGKAHGSVKVFDILPFQFNQALELVSRITTDSDVVNILRDGLLRISNQMVFTPIALELLIEIAEAEREIPGAISEIFDRYTDLALGRGDSKKGIQVVFDYFAKKKFLSELAWREFKQKDRTELTRAEFEGFVQCYVETFGWNLSNFDVLIEEIERSGILRLSDDVYFSHRSFLEFFVALWIVDNRQDVEDYEQWLVDLYFDGLWSEVALYAVGQTRMASESLVTRVLDYCSTSLEHDLMKFMVGRLLQAGWHSTAEVKQKAMSRGLETGDVVLKHLEEMQSRDPDHIPAIVPHMFLLIFAEYSYGSRILLSEARSLLDKMVVGTTESQFQRRLALTWAIRDRIDESELGVLVELALEDLTALQKKQGITTETRFAGLLFLEQLSRYDKAVVKGIKRRARRLLRNNPTLSRGMPSLPSARKGSRR